MAATGSAYAASRIISAMRAILTVRSVVDVGCARGTWLREWQAQGVEDVVGVDGDYVDREKLEIDARRFTVSDLAAPFSLGRRFDLAQSLEVAEHLPKDRAISFVADIVAHAPIVLFSAATPGQGGENHLNEQPGEYWRRLFLDHGYIAIDCLRPLLTRERDIPAWYRYNTMLYAEKSSMSAIDPFALQFTLRDGEPFPDLSPVTYRLRKLVVRMLPSPLHNRLAQLNARRFPAG
jgi:SAM-dependent methyltransferase